MPEPWAREALEALVRLGIISDTAQQRPDWTRQVTRYEAAAALAPACDVVGRTSDPAVAGAALPPDLPADHDACEAVKACIRRRVIYPSPARFRGLDVMTRMDFARWLDRLIGSPPLPALPQELANLPKEPILDSVWGLHSEEALSSPEKFHLFTDISCAADSAVVHRLAWWLIIRPPQYYQPDRRFHPDKPVNWNEFVVCLHRAVSFLKPEPKDSSTPEGALAALQHAFWRADFGEMDRYISDFEDEELRYPPRVGMRLSRFTFVDAQEALDARVTRVERLSPSQVLLHVDYIPQWGDQDQEAIVWARDDEVWKLAGLR